ncbi:Membrane protein ptm1 [Savitreella phatthalungensis]
MQIGWLSVLVGLLTVVQANVVQINNKLSQQCSGMFARASVGGNRNPYIRVEFETVSVPGDSHSHNNISVVVFEYQDIDRIGIRLPPLEGSSSERSFLICDDDAIAQDLCTDRETGQFLISKSARNATKATVVTQAIALEDPLSLHYDIKKTSYYCVSTLSATGTDYRGSVRFANSYGELPASEYFNLPFYGALAVAYVLIGFLWGFQYYQHKTEILPVQNYLTALMVFLTCEMIIVWGYYDYVNIHGFTIGSRIYMVIVSVLSALRNSFSFFMILIVSLGYSVVRPSLGPAMLKARMLAVVHFCFGSLYGVASMAVGTADAPSLWTLFVILPLSACMTVFYFWTVQAMRTTIAELENRGQWQKSMMYRRLHGVIWWSIVAVCAFILLQSFTFYNADSPDFVPRHWKDRMVLNGWLNTLYLSVFVTIIFLWRPTKDNRRFAMSDEVRQEDYDMDVNLQSDEDEEDGQTGRQHASKPRTSISNQSENFSETAFASSGSGRPGRTAYQVAGGTVNDAFDLGDEDDSDEDMKSRPTSR